MVDAPVDIGMSHDWPRGAAERGDLGELFKFKSFLEIGCEVCLFEIKSGKFGNPAVGAALDHLKP